MIVPMQKVTILCLESDTETTLEALRDLGVLHVTPCTAPTGDTAKDAHERLAHARHAVESIEAHDKHPHLHKTPETDPAEIDDLIETIYALQHDYNHWEDRLKNLQHIRHSLTPYGDFNPDTIAELANNGITVKLFHTRDIESLEMPEQALVHIVSRTKSGTQFALIGKGEFKIDAQEVHLPHTSLHQVTGEIEEAENTIHAINKKLAEFTSELPLLKEALIEREMDARFCEVHDTLGIKGKIAYLHGFCPTENLPEIQKTATEQGWGIISEQPTQEDDVPTLIRYPGWVRPIKAVLDMLAIVPGYRESDISGIFLIFFSIFFAILIGDAGYGFLFLAATLFARHKKPKAPAYPFVLFGLLSVCTIIWGALTGNYFGIQPAVLPGFLKGLQLSWLTSEGAQDHVMTLCFLIGAIHLTIAHIWNAVALAPSPKAFAQLGWIGLVWSMFFVALTMVLQQPLPGFFGIMFIASIILILLFMTSPRDIKTEWIQHAMFPLSVVNCFVDIVSYIRLFAVGLASLSVAQSFNDMALQLGWQKVWTIPIMAMILLAGHGLNIILCALGILVHGVRLNTLEFSLHKNLEWKGTPYKPFARTTSEL